MASMHSTNVRELGPYVWKRDLLWDQSLGLVDERSQSQSTGAALLLGLFYRNECTVDYCSCL